MARGYEQSLLVPMEDLGFANPCGGVFSSANDMAKLLSFLLRDNAPRDDKVCFYFAFWGLFGQETVKKRARNGLKLA